MNRYKLREYYKGLPVIPVRKREKDPIHIFSNFRRYTIDDIQDDNNVAILTGTEVARNKFLAILDCDVDINNDKGFEIFQIVKNNCLDTTIVKSGGKHNGFHVYFTTEIPIKSGLLVFNNGFIEIKGIRENGYAEQIMLPPSVNKTKYRVIYPKENDFVDFKKVRFLTTDELKNRLKIINNEIKLNKL